MSDIKVFVLLAGMVALFGVIGGMVKLHADFRSLIREAFERAQ